MINARESAEVFALRAVSWLVGQETILPGFFAATGIGAGDLPDHASDPEFLASVLDYLLSDDSFVTRFCDEANLPYDTVGKARAALPGGDLPHWT